jgi:hypothetical protein
MRTIVTTIAIAAYTLHLMLGCCWHHAHGADCPPGHVHGPQAYDHVHVHLHDHSHADHQHHQPLTPTQSSDQDDSQPGASCGDGQCSYVVAEVVTIPQCDLVTLLPTVTSQPLVFATIGARSSWVDEQGSYAPPVRAHLAHSQLLN